MKQNLELRISSKVNRSADELCDAILGLHAFTGCDSVSAFAGKEKSKAIKILITSDEYIDLFKNFGQQWQVNKDEMATLECFTCELYGQKKTSINDVRYNLYCNKDGNIGSEQLSPCANSLCYHVKRSCYQAKIWRSSFIGNYSAPPLNDYGWQLNDGVLSVVWFSCKPAPEQCMDLLSCSCKKECIPSSCCFIGNALPCTDMCSIDCQNKTSTALHAMDINSDAEDD